MPVESFRYEVEEEQRLRDIVQDMGLDTPFIRSFLRTAAKEYLKVFGLKGRIVNIDAPSFIFEISGKNWARRRIRVPIVDFFKGKSSVAQRDYELHKTVMKAKQYSKKLAGKNFGLYHINPK